MWGGEADLLTKSFHAEREDGPVRLKVCVKQAGRPLTLSEYRSEMK